jgi:hypothetical protein
MISFALKKRIDEYAAQLEATSELLALARAGTLRIETVALYLVSVRHLVRHTPAELGLARRSALARSRSDLAAYFEQKLAEENGHDLWADDDLGKLRERFGASSEHRPLASMQALIDFVLQLAESDPESYLAYILFAEYFTVVIGPVWIEALRHIGIPADAMTVIGHHVELDVHHVREGSAELDALVRTDDGARRLHAALTATTLHYDAFLAQLAQANQTWQAATPTPGS